MRRIAISISPKEFRVNSHPIKRRLALGALTLALVTSAACGSGDTDTQKGVEDTTTTTAPAAASVTTATTAAPAATTTTAKPVVTTTATPVTTTTTEGATTTTTEPAAEEAYYANCDAARAAGVAPIYEGQPGYRTGLDRDRDGIACDK